jgi:glycosyltransferase involved in cell wall biosynthesis
VRQVREFLPGPVETVGLLDEQLPALPPEYEALTDSVRYATSPGPLREGAILVQPSPMTHDAARLAPLLGRREVLGCTIIHDFIPLDEPRYLPTVHARRAYMTNLVWLKYYRLFFPNSHFSGRRLREVLDVPSDRIQVTGCSMRSAFATFRAEQVEGVAPPCRFFPRHYFLTVGGHDVRKNAEAAVTAHAQLLARTHCGVGFVLVGNYLPDYCERLREIFCRQGGQPQQIEFIRDIADADLAVLYHHAIATICPSRMEGFSMPVVEAMACGCPVLAASNEAHTELVVQPEALFQPDDHERLTALMAELLRSPGHRERLIQRQKGVATRFHEREVARRFWTRAHQEFRALRRGAVRRAGAIRPRLAFLTPFPPDRSGVAEYTARSLRHIGKLADVDVFTDARVDPLAHPHVRRFQPLSEFPYITEGYDRVIAVVGNSHFHTRVIDYHCRHGGVCLAHDNRLAELYSWWRGPQRFAEMATRSLKRPVSVEEAQSWVTDPGRLPGIFFDEILNKADPLVVHSRGIQAQVARQYGRESRYLPFCPYRHFTEEELQESSGKAARVRLGLPADQLVLISLGIVAQVKGSLECVWALEQLHAWGMPAHLYFVGESTHFREPLQQLAGRLGVGNHVHQMSEWISDREYRDFILAADFAIQLRTHCFGGLSGAMLDCISAGLPTVTNEDLARAMDAPGFVLRIPDHLSPPLIAEQLANAFDAGLHRARPSPAREAYVREHSFDNYAVQMLQVLGLN